MTPSPEDDTGGYPRHRFVLAVLAAVIVVAFSSLEASAAPVVDPALVGTRQLSVPNPQRISLWIWKINADGTYSFHAEGPGSAPPHGGNFSAAGGQYTLKSTTMNWTDSGTYQLLEPSTMQATGRPGTASWQRKGSAVSAASPPAGPPRLGRGLLRECTPRRMDSRETSRKPRASPIR